MNHAGPDVNVTMRVQLVLSEQRVDAFRARQAHAIGASLQVLRRRSADLWLAPE